ncbi:MAG: acyltransferase family protein [Limisphaerales bacterium]
MSSSQKDTRYYSLDFWRGVACLMVVVFHSSFDLIDNPNVAHAGWEGKWITRLLTHLWLGVPIFFVISGYCITAACDAAKTRPQPTKRYFIRRFRRIYPPYWITLLLLFLLMMAPWLAGHPDLFATEGHLTHPMSSFSISRWFGNITLTEGIRPHFFGAGSWYFLGPSWTLCYEEQFYAICGLLLLAAGRHFFSAAAWLTAGVVGVVAVAACTKLAVAGFFFDGHWLLFEAGMVVYYSIHHGSARFARLAGAGLILAGVVAILSRVITKVYTEEYYVGFFFAFLILALYRWDFAIATNRLLRPITYCGIMCYSLYLIHEPLVRLVSHIFYVVGIKKEWAAILLVIPFCTMLAAVLGWGFHLAVERRFLNTLPVFPWHMKRREVETSAALAPLTPGSAVADIVQNAGSNGRQPGM